MFCCCLLFGSSYYRSVVWKETEMQLALNISDVVFKFSLVFQVSLYVLQQSSLELLKSD